MSKKDEILRAAADKATAEGRNVLFFQPGDMTAAEPLPDPPASVFDFDDLPLIAEQYQYLLDRLRWKDAT